MRPADFVVSRDSSGAVLVVPEHIVLIRIHWINFRDVRRDTVQLIPRLCLAQDPNSDDGNGQPCPYCTGVLSTPSKRFIMYNEFSNTTVALSPTMAERIQQNVVTSLDKFFPETWERRSKSNVVSIRALPVSGCMPMRKFEIACLYEQKAVTRVSEDFYTPPTFEDAAIDCKRVMQKWFEAPLTPRAHSDLCDILANMAQDNKNFILDYVNVTYDGIPVIAIELGELELITGTFVGAVETFRREPERLAFTAFHHEKV